MKIKILVDNISNISELKGEHGFSAFIEDEKIRILFDTGVSENVIKNAELLRINLKQTDFVIISHNHYDHTGGINVLKKKFDNKPNLIIGEKFFTTKYKKNNSEYQKISNDFIIEKELSDFFKIIYVNDILKLSDNIFIIRLSNGKSILKDYFFIKDTKENFVEDNFNDEIILVYKNNNELSILSGCSHTGIEHIIKTVSSFFKNEKIKTIIGGLHLEKVTDNYFFKFTDMLKQKKIMLYPGHCTGGNRLKQLKELLKNNCETLEIGKEINV